MLMVIRHTADVESALCTQRVVLDVDAEFYSIQEKVTPSGNIYCAISVIQYNNPPIHINIPGNIEQVVDKINISIALVKTMCNK